MYAVFETGGKQYRVAENDVIFVEKLAAAEGDEVVFENVLMLGKKSELPMSRARKLSESLRNKAKTKKSSFSNTSRRRITGKSKGIVSLTRRSK